MMASQSQRVWVKGEGVLPAGLQLRRVLVSLPRTVPCSCPSGEHGSDDNQGRPRLRAARWPLLAVPEMFFQRNSRRARDLQATILRQSRG